MSQVQCPKCGAWTLRTDGKCWDCKTKICEPNGLTEKEKKERENQK